MEKFPDEPVIQLDVDGEIFNLEPRNTDIYMHLGRYAIYNHIYHAPDDDDCVLYIFEFNDTYEELKNKLIELGYPVRDGIHEPLDTDVAVYTEVFLEHLERYWDE